MDTIPYVVHPTFSERFFFLVERFLRMYEIGMKTGATQGEPTMQSARLLTESELERSEVIRLSSAVKHLAWGDTVSHWSHDRYLDRLKNAKPELRAKALAEHGYTETDYQIWLEMYADPDQSVAAAN